MLELLSSVNILHSITVVDFEMTYDKSHQGQSQIVLWFGMVGIMYLLYFQK